MATFKKKDIKKLKTNSTEIEELIDVDGSPIGGDETNTNDSEIKVPSHVTTDRFKSGAIGPRSYYNTYGGTPYSRGSSLGEDEEVGDVAKNKMKKMVEDVLSQQNQSNDFVNKTDNSDVNRNGIPDLEDFAKQKPMIDRELKSFISKIARIQLTGEEKGIILNHIIQNMNTTDIPRDYKQILSKTLR